MLNRIAAEAVLGLHFVFVAFAVLGGFLGFVGIEWLWVHATAVAWSSIVNLAGWTCPLTPLEKSFRRATGGDGYAGGFITHYLGPIVYPGGMPRRLELTAGVSIVVWNAVVYAIVLTLRSA